MPLNPPSWLGQDTWYSPSVYVNQVAVALWQPAVPQASALTTIPVIPSPTQTFTSQQQSLMTSSITTSTLEGGTTMTEGDGVSPDAAPGQTNGPVTTAIDPVAAGQGGYQALLNNLSKVLGEAQSGSWSGVMSNPNMQTMLTTTGVNQFVVTSGVWCATWAGYILKVSGLPFVVGASSGKVSTLAADYKGYGNGADPGNPSGWCRGDIAVVKRPGGFHVAFLWGLTANNNIVLLGGNQGGPPSRVAADHWYPGSKTNGNVVAVRRAWDVPSGTNSLPILS